MESAATWTALGLMAAVSFSSVYFLGTRSDTRFTELAGQMRAQGAELGVRIDGLSMRIDAQGLKIDAQGAVLTERIDALARDLGARIDAQTARIDAQTARIDAHLQRHSA